MKPTSLAFWMLLIGLSGATAAEAQTAPHFGGMSSEPPVEIAVPRVSARKYRAIAVDATWLKTLARSKAVPGVGSSYSNWRLRDVSAPPASKLALERSYYVGSFVGGDRKTDLWIAEADGKKAKQIMSGPPSSIGPVLWSPNGKYLAYVEVEKRVGRLFVVDAKSLRKTLIAEGVEAPRSVPYNLAEGVGAPLWTPDGSGLLFWQEKEWRKGQWQAHRATNVSQQPKREVVSELVTNQPGVFSPDGKRLAVSSSEYGDVIVETLSDHSKHSVRGPIRVSDMKWSLDSQWLYLQADGFPSESPRGATYVVDLSQGKPIEVDRSLGGIPIAEGTSEYVSVSTGQWLPGAGHRLLVFAHNTAPIRTGIGMPAITKPEARFLIFDADTKTTFEVEGMPKLQNNPGFLGSPGIARVSGGTSLLINYQLYKFEIAP